MAFTSQLAWVGRDRWARRDEANAPDAATTHDAGPRRLATALALGAVLVPAVALHFAPESLRADFLYDRDAIAAGEWWRLATGHWVHFGPSHLRLNLITLLGAGLWLERLRAGELVRYIALAAPLLGALLWVLEPAMATYGGLSGLACGALTLAALQSPRSVAGSASGPVRGEVRLTRICSAALLVVIAMKSVGDLSAQSFSLVAFDSTADVRVSAWAHAAGALLGLVFFLSRPRRKSCPLPSAGALAS